MKPTEAGFYWVRFNDQLSVAHYRANNEVEVIGSNAVFHIDRFEWLAPVEPLKEVKPNYLGLYPKDYIFFFAFDPDEDSERYLYVVKKQYWDAKQCLHSIGITNQIVAWLPEYLGLYEIEEDTFDTTSELSEDEIAAALRAIGFVQIQHEW